MDVRTAASLIRAAVPAGAATWADLGAGSGTFTRALLTLLGPEGRVVAVDKDASALAELRVATSGTALGARVVSLHHDFRKPHYFPPLDGVLLANALHFVPPDEQAAVLARLKNYLRPEGRLVVVDYDGREANAWVPHPVSQRRLSELFEAIGLAAPALAGNRPSRYGGTLYAAWSAVSGPPSEERA
ncbi:MAG TPA: class I SAM-dependent methyltransferase [Gemmatimonadaceae bacterium]|nr:class I SAM-dependent methyltransferase [Gemmatimonadaceae bacterium]